MKTTTRSLLGSLLALGTLMTSSQPATAATPVYSSWHLKPITESNWVPYPVSGVGSAWTNGIMKVISKQADSKGGSIHFTMQNPGGAKKREFNINWTFPSVDVTDVYQSKPISISIGVWMDATTLADLRAGANGNAIIAVRGKGNSLHDSPGSFRLLDAATQKQAITLDLPLDNRNAAYGFGIEFYGFGAANSYDQYEFDYLYNGVQTATNPPPSGNPTLNTPNWFYIGVGSSYYTFTKSGNNMIMGLYGTSSAWTLSYVTDGTLVNVGHGIVVKQAGTNYSFFIPDKNATGIYKGWLFYKMDNSTTWYGYTGMIGVQ